MARYLFEQVVGDPDYDFRVTDTLSGMVVEFKSHDFNGSHRVVTSPTVPEGMKSQDAADYIAKTMRELGDWLVYHRSWECFPECDFELRLSRDNEELYLIGHKSPVMQLKVNSDTSINELVERLEKAVEWLKNTNLYERSKTE